MRGIVVCVPLAAAIIASWWYGGYQVSAQFVVCCLALGAGALWLLESMSWQVRRREFRLPTLALLFIAVLAVGIWHLSPSDNPLVAEMAHAEFENLRSVVADGALKVHSLYPAATRLWLSLFVIGFLTWLVCSEPLRSPGLLRFLLGLVAINGMGIAVYGIVRRAQGTDFIFETLSAQAGFSSFINRNQAAGFLNLSIAAGAGWFVLARQEKYRPAMDWDAPVRRPAFSIPRLLSSLSGEQLLAATCVGIMAAGVVMTYSRGGIGSLFISATAAGSLATRRWGLAAACIALAAGLAIALSVYLGEWSVIQARLQTLSDPSASWQGRLTHWSDTFGAVKDFPWTGTGWGTYAYANLPYQRHDMQLWSFNADNLYFESLVEGGVIGATLFVLMWLLLLYAVLRLTASAANQEARALAVVGLIAWTAQAVHSTTDFGLLRPPAGILFAVLMGLIFGEAVHNVRLKPPGRWLMLGSLPGWSRFAFGAVCVAVAGLGTWEAARAASCSTAVESLPGLNPLSEANDSIAGIDEHIDNLETAIQRRPDDAHARRKLAELWIHRYRLTVFEQLREQPELTRHMAHANLWRLTDPSMLQHVYMMHVSAYGLEGGEAIRQEPAVIENLIPAAEQLRLARRACPVSRRIDMLCGMLGTAFQEDPDGRRSISRSMFASPGRSTRLMDLGQMAWNAFHDDLASACFARALQLSSSEVWRAFSLMRERMTDEVIVNDVLPARADVLLELADRLFPDDPARPLLVERLEEIAEATTLELHQRGRIAELSGDYAAAIDAYRLALADEPEDTQMRAQLVGCHLALHDLDAAENELKLGLSHAPDSQVLLELKEQLLEMRLER